MAPLAKLLSLLPLLAIGAQAATKDDWRSRSIYQLLTDRFAPPADNTPCELGSRSYCGGNWQTVISKLDYIQALGFDAIWISPTALNLEGYTQYGEAYHGYWTADPTKLNPHFGTDADLKALSAAVHSRGMLLMTDIAINALASTSTSLSADSLASDADGTLLFKDPADYHPRCPIAWGNSTSEQECWLAVGHDTGDVALMDLKLESDRVAGVLKNWVGGYVNEYGIDGFRVDASKHMSKEFQHDFCEAAGTFCMGEVAGGDTAVAGSYQGDDGIDSVCGFGLMYGFVKVFTGGSTMSTLSYYISKAAESYSDPTVIGQFLDNQDLPRFNSLTSDRTLVYNAIVGSFMYGGMPIVYYGLEQDVSDGLADPANREALWNYNNYAQDGETFGRIASLNKIRTALGGVGNLHNAVGTVLAQQDQDIAIKREEALIVLTNRGAGATGTWSIPGTQFGNNAAVIDLLSCSTTATTDASGVLEVTFTTGEPFVWVTVDVAAKAGLCGAEASNSTTTASESATSTASVSGTSTESVSATVTAVESASASASASESESASESVSTTSSAPGNVAIVTGSETSASESLTTASTTATGTDVTVSSPDATSTAITGSSVGTASAGSSTGSASVGGEGSSTATAPASGGSTSSSCRRARKRNAAGKRHG
ncbi:hypothetical protein IAT38_007345 [Cryptococcus sp. DSM 104549]